MNQEKGTVEYVVDNHLGFAIHSEEEFKEILSLSRKEIEKIQERLFLSKLPNYLGLARIILEKSQ